MKKLFCIILAVLTMASFTACGKDKGPAVDEDGNKTITFVGVEDTALSNLLITLKNEGSDETMRDNRWTRLYKEKLKVNVDYKWIAKGWDQKREKLGLSLTNVKQLPDVITFDDLGMALEAYEGGVIVDIKSAYDQYASPLVKEYFNTPDGKNLMAQATMDGKLIALPGLANSLVQTPILMIRKDWREKLNLEAPSKRSDVLNIIKEFAENIDGAYGLGLTQNLEQYVGKLDGFGAMFGALPHAWYEDNGNVVFGGIQPETLTALEELRKMYLKKAPYTKPTASYLHPEFITKDEARLQSDIKNGKVGVVFAPVWMPWESIKANKRLDPESEWEYYPVFDENGIAEVNADAFARSYIGLNRNFKDQKLFFDMVNLYFETCWGETKQPEKYLSDETHDNFWHLSPLQFLHPDGDVYIYDKYMEVVNDESKLESADFYTKYLYGIHQKKEKGEELDINEYVAASMYLEGGTASVLKQYRNAGKDKTSWKYVLKSRVTFGSVQLTSYISIIKDEDIDTNQVFNDFVSTWKEKGGNKLIDEYNKWFKGVKG